MGFEVEEKSVNRRGGFPITGTRVNRPSYLRIMYGFDECKGLINQAPALAKNNKMCSNLLNTVKK